MDFTNPTLREQIIEKINARDEAAEVKQARIRLITLSTELDDATLRAFLTCFGAVCILEGSSSNLAVGTLAFMGMLEKVFGKEITEDAEV